MSWPADEQQILGFDHHRIGNRRYVVGDFPKSWSLPSATGRCQEIEVRRAKRTEVRALASEGIQASPLWARRYQEQRR